MGKPFWYSVRPEFEDYHYRDNVLMGVVDYGMNIQEAVDAPRFHNQWLPDV